MPIDRGQLRLLVREVLRDALPDLKSALPAAPPKPQPAVSQTPVAEAIGAIPTGPLAAGEKSRTDTVRIANDRDLQGFVRTLLQLFENPKNRADLRAGRLTFRLVEQGRSGAPTTHRFDSGAVTERQVADLAAAGGVLVLGRRAVLTPLAREKARALGITIEKERT
ncbi:hypothetical protein [Mycolicibacterium komossense]|uniref:Uncharacterized protein n=1 Tax=Mycolicibacterium komossense TaxID=1779 RepID=A0ABT3CHP6_9MYCO|nr:hypothetical protein [Mycolicibacterium komossense]MCV7228977.1 hypothetical protein [Mycolicibacterium komossense]